MKKKPEEQLPGLTRKSLGCHFCELTFSTQSSRSHHKAAKHPREHKMLKGHKKSPDYPCRFCYVGFGTPKSRWNHHQRCLSNPAVLNELKKMKKADEVVKKELKDAGKEQGEVPRTRGEEKEGEDEEEGDQ